MLISHSGVFRHWDDPLPEQVAATVDGFLDQLGGPVIIKVSGRDNSRCRFMVTLLHGNEPSGIKATHHLLCTGFQPEVTMFMAIVSVDAALADPLFTYRFLPGQNDMNRLFTASPEDNQGAIAIALLEIIRNVQPEAVVDVHNTSGDGPAFAVCVEPHAHYLDLATFFSHRLIVTGHRLGALMEVSDLDCPILTVECGGASQLQSDEIALKGLTRFFSQTQLYTSVAVEEVDIYYHPVRLELAQGGRLSYSNEFQPDMDITLPIHIDRRNFGVARPDTSLAWLSSQGFRQLRVMDECGRNVIDNFFVERDGKLYPKTTLKLFMATTNPDIAVSDCLFYAVKETDHDWGATGGN